MTEVDFCLKCWAATGWQIPIVNWSGHEAAHRDWLDLPDEEKMARVERQLFGERG